jgi:hypothetical protein
MFPGLNFSINSRKYGFLNTHPVYLPVFSCQKYSVPCRSFKLEFSEILFLKEADSCENGNLTANVCVYLHVGYVCAGRHATRIQ